MVDSYSLVISDDKLFAEPTGNIKLNPVVQNIVKKSNFINWKAVKGPDLYYRLYKEQMKYIKYVWEYCSNNPETFKEYCNAVTVQDKIQAFLPVYKAYINSSFYEAKKPFAEQILRIVSRNVMESFEISLKNQNNQDCIAEYIKINKISYKESWSSFFYKRWDWTLLFFFRKKNFYLWIWFFFSVSNH